MKGSVTLDLGLEVTVNVCVNGELVNSVRPGRDVLSGNEDCVVATVP